MKKYLITLTSLLIVIASLFLPPPPGLSRDGFIMLAILLMAVILWLTEAIPLAATGLLILALQPLLGIASAQEVFSSFGNRAVFFILASFMLMAAVEKHALHKKMAAHFLRIFGSSPKMFIIGVALTGCLFSFFMQAHGVAAMLLPLCLEIVIITKVVPKESNFGVATMLSLAYGTGIGSWGTLLGGARNPLTIAFLDEIGYSISFLDWIKICMPIVFLTLPLVIFIILRLHPPEVEDIEKAVKEAEQSISRGMTKEEKGVLAVFAATVLLWIFFSDEIGVAVIALLAVSSLFIFHLIEWEDVEKRVQWGIILVYGGAITMGINLADTGAARWLADGILNISPNKYVILLLIMLLTFLLTNLMSNTAAVATMLPISLSAALKAGISPVIAAMATATAGGVAFMFVVGTPAMAIAYSSGYLKQHHIFKAGIIAGMMSIAIIFLMAIFYWEKVLHL